MKTKIRSVFLLAIALLEAACDEPSDTDIETLTYEAASSACGGFEEVTRGTQHCDAEIRRWTYSAATRTLKLANTRVMLNCCGEHDATASLENGVYTITEHDAPEELEDGSVWL